MNPLKVCFLLALVLVMNCTQKKSYTPSEMLFIKQAQTYERKINDYLFELGTLQWRINGIMDKYDNNPVMYLADIEYQNLIKQKNKIVGKPTSTFIHPTSATDMNINIINIGVDEDKIDSLDLTALKNTEGVIVMKDNGLFNQTKASTSNTLLPMSTNTQMVRKLNQQLLGIPVSKV